MDAGGDRGALDAGPKGGQGQGGEAGHAGGGAKDRGMEASWKCHITFVALTCYCKA